MNNITIPQRNKAISKTVRVLQDPETKEIMDRIQERLKPVYGHVSYAKIYNMLENYYLVNLEKFLADAIPADPSPA